MIIGAVIVHYGDLSVTNQCLISLSKSIDNIELVIINCGSNCRYNWPDNQVIYSPGNLGYGGACNYGFNKIKDKCDFVIMMNNDVTFFNTTIPQIMQHIQNKTIGDLNCPVVMNSQNQITYDGGRITLSGAKHYHRGGYFKDFKTDFIYGCCIIVRTSAFKKLGCYREEYFMYWEDVDLSFRAKAAGMSLKCLGDVFIRHNDKPQYGVMRYYHTRNALLFAKFNYSPMMKIVHRIYFFSFFLPVRVVFFLIKKKFKAVKYCIIGTKDFFNGKVGMK